MTLLLTGLAIFLYLEQIVETAHGDRPGEQTVIECMKALRAAGGTFDGIAATLNSEGTLTRYGSNWFGSTVCKILKAEKA
jgi:hypothetical protein